MKFGRVPTFQFIMHNDAAFIWFRWAKVRHWQVGDNWTKTGHWHSLSSSNGSPRCATWPADCKIIVRSTHQSLAIINSSEKSEAWLLPLNKSKWEEEEIVQETCAHHHHGPRMMKPRGHTPNVCGLNDSNFPPSSTTRTKKLERAATIIHHFLERLNNKSAWWMLLHFGNHFVSLNKGINVKSSATLRVNVHV